MTKFMDDGRNHPFAVYIAINKINGNSYIGATEKGTERRSAIHLSNAKRDEKDIRFYRAIKKHGEENFLFLTIKECENYGEALESERAYIALFNPRYNMTEGGGGIKGYRHTPETIAKMSAAKKGKPAAWLSKPNADEIRLKLSQKASRKGVKKLNASAKESLLKRSLKANAARRKSILNLDTGEVYRSVVEASAALKLTLPTVVRLCREGKRPRAWKAFANLRYAK